MFYVTKIFEFCAAHSIEGVPKCKQIHGHNFVIHVTLCNENLDQNSMVMDLRQMSYLMQPTLDKYDHVYINEMPPEFRGQPTAENLARQIYREFGGRLNRTGKSARLHSVKIYENDRCSAEYIEEG